ncbi:stage III sporulation protein AG [Pseudogracilibacillus sp. ICA-222130]|uniref:stage III sporulation protein AG n=1 Tax=Pseudogracilibacillus sp. ICA-222130 TaxID=3134655 RepID=UPI0030C277D2
MGEAIIIKWIKYVVSWIEKDKKNKYILLIGLIGMLVLFIGNNNKKIEEPNDVYIQEQDAQKETETIHVEDEHIRVLEEQYEQSLQHILNKMNGIQDAEVMINIDSTNVQIYEKDHLTQKQQTEEQDTNGGTRQVEDESKETKIVFVREGEKEVPLLTQLKKPEVRGVLIIANGVQSANKQKEVIDAVAKVLDIPTYKISVQQK